MQAWGDDGKSRRPLEWQCFNLLLYTAVHRGFFMDQTSVLNSVSAQTPVEMSNRHPKLDTTKTDHVTGLDNQVT